MRSASNYLAVFRHSKKLLIQFLTLVLIVSSLSVISLAKAPEAKAATVTATGTNPTVCNQDVTNTPDSGNNRIDAYRNTINSIDYCIIEFRNTTVNTWTKPAGVAAIDFLVVGGGGGGGSNAATGGGGGGSISGTLPLTSGITALKVVVGAGGAGGANNTSQKGNNGGQSEISKSNDSLIARASGGEGGEGWRGLSPANVSRAPGGGTFGYSQDVVNLVTNSGGGGGMGSTTANSAPQVGENGPSNSITGGTYGFGAGGGGGVYGSGNGAAGGSWSGGAGGSSNVTGTSGGDLGAGGGGGGDNNRSGGSGAKGIVILRYAIPVTVTFNSNNETPTTSTQSIPYNTATALTANSFTRTGYTFAGWDAAADGSGTDYTNQQSVSITSNMTLFAKWTENACTKTETSSGGYTIEKITHNGSCVWTTPTGVTAIEVAVIAGGGGGGFGSNAGGGGAGEVLVTGSSAALVSASITSTSTIATTVGSKTVVTVGAGGTSGAPNGNQDGAGLEASWLPGGDGGASSFGSITANGGGGGGGGSTPNVRANGAQGGSGGGAASNGTGGSAGTNSTPSNWKSFRNAGSSSAVGGFGGGGGAGGAGLPHTGSVNVRSGGLGVTLWGSKYAGGGGSWQSLGAENNVNDSVLGGNGRLSESGNVYPYAGTSKNTSAGVANTGTGGGGGAPGGSGVVVIRYVNVPSISLSNISGTVNSAISSYSITNSGGPITSYSISPALTSNGTLSFSTSTGLISGTPTATLASTNYTITATNSSGTSTATFSLAINNPTCSPTENPSPPAGFTVLTFTNATACNWSVPAGVTVAQVLVVGGGGGGGGAHDNASAGGGGAGFVYANSTESISGTIAISIGAGGTGGVGVSLGTFQNGNSGGNSIFGSVTARGGGGGFGGYESSTPWTGSCPTYTTPVKGGTAATGSQAATGGQDGCFNRNGFGGGGQSSTSNQTGGAGLANTITGSSVTYGIGGSGATLGSNSSPAAQLAGTGNGGTGAAANSSTGRTGGTGGSGVVIVRYANGSASGAAITTQPSGAVSRSALTTQPVIRIVDGNGTTVTSSTVNVVASIASGSGTLSGTTTVAAVSGVATFTNLVITGTGNHTLTFTPTSLAAATSNSFAVSETAITANALTSKVTAPVRSATPSTTAVDDTQFTGTVAWFESNGTTAAPSTFAANTVYVAKVTLTAKTGYTLTGLSGSFTYTGATSVSYSSGVVTITFAATDLASRTISFATTAYSKAYSETQVVSATASLGSGSVTYSVGSSTACTVSGSTVTISSGTGTCSVTASVASDGTYASATTTTPVTITVSKAVSTIGLSVGTYTYTGSGLGPDSATTSGSTGAVTYAYAGRGSTSYTSSPTKPTAVGTYTVTATLAADANYASVSTASQNFEITSAGLVVTPTISASSMVYGTSGGSLPTISYTKNPDVSLTTNPTCALYLASDTGFVTTQTLGATLAAGSYVVRCAGAAATNYTISYGTNPSFIVTKLDITLTVGNPASTPYTGSSVSVTNTFTRTSGTLAGSDAISGMTYTYTSAGGYNSTTAPTAGGNYTITGSNATFSTGSASNYTITYVAGALTITTATQTVTWAPNTNLLTTDSPATPSALATALGSATISYAVTSAGTTGCTVNSSTAVLTFTAAGNCQVTATAAATSNYATASTAVTFAISIPTYVITLAAGTNGSGSNQTLTKTRGVDLTLPNSATANGYFTRTGYSVTGWSTTNLGSQTHALGGSFTTEAATTLYPVWTLVSCSPTSSVANGYTIYRFTTVGTCTWTVPNGLTNVEVLAVAGGGGGGYSYGNTGAGGGGGGQVKTGTATLGSTLEVTVGAGGTAGTLSAGRGGSGGNSIVSSITALGGNGGCGVASPSCSVASAATASAAANGGAADQPVTGFSWKRGRGGGGSSGVRGTETGGDGTASDYSGTSTSYGAGGSGGSKQDSSANIVGTTGTANTGNGGGGAGTGTSSDSDSSLGANGGAGGSGVVVVRTGNTLNITYDANGGSAPSGGAATTITGGTISSLATTSRTGYTFSGWFTAASGGTQITTSAAHTRSANFTLYAQWSANSLTVTYDSQGGSAVTSGSVNTGANISAAPTTPTRAGYTLSGWSTTSTGSVVTFPYTHSQTASFTLFAIWSANALTVTYNAKGGTTVSDGTVNTAASISAAPTAPTRTGYTLSGWSATDGGTVVTFPYAHGQTANFTLYAKWIALTTNAITYNNQSATTAQVGGSTSYTTDAAIATIPTTAPLRVGYTFAGWFTDPSAGTQVTNGTYTPASPYGSITLYAQWTANSLTVTYNSKGGTTVSNGSVNTAASISTAPTAPTRAGYTFTAWSATDGGIAINFPFAHGQTANFTLYALWTAGSLVVTYNSQGGSAVSNGTAATGASISSAPTAPTRTGYTFDGWSTTDGGIAINFPFAHGQTTNFTLYARWSLRVYSVAFNANSGTGTMGNQSFTHGVTTSLNANLYSRANYVFHRWATAADGTGTTYNNFAQAALTAETTLYAQWTANTYVVTFNYNGGDGGDSTATASYTTAGTAITLPVPTKTGFTFAGWHSDAGLTTAIGSGGGSGSYSPTGATLSLNAYAKWTAINYTFTYNSNSADSGTVPTETSKQITQTATVKANTGSLALAGYTFSGWNTASDGTGTNYLSGSLFTVGSSNVTLYAKWSANTYTITYNTNGGTGNAQRSSTNVSSDTYTTGGSSVVFPGIGTLERIGFTFGGWNTSAAGTGTNYSAANTYTTVSNVIFYAKWNPVTYTITYNGNTSNGGSAPTAGGYTTGQASPYEVLANTFTKTSNVFGGWNTAANGTGTSYSPNSSITTLANIVLYATWIPQFTLHYAINGGTVTSGSLPSDTLHNSGASVGPIFGSVSRTGYTFAGWANGSATILGGSNFTILEDSVLTAKWNPINYTITYNSDGGTEAPATSTKQIGQSFTVEAAVSKPGYTFTGWSNGSTVVGADAVVVMGSANIAYTAQWVARVFTVSYDWNGGRGTAEADVNYTFGTTAITLPLVGDRVKDGYTFAGWSESVSGSLLSATYIPSRSRTLYALWTLGNFTVTYNLSGGTLANAAVAVQNGSSTVLPLPTRANFVFDGWHTATAGGSSLGSHGTSFTPTASQTVYARWIQSSLYGITDSLTRIGSVVTVANVGNTFSGANSSSSVAVSVPENALPAGTTINFDMVGNSSRATGLLPNVTYLISIAISWIAGDGTVPDTASGKPISVTISNATIKTGATAYAIVNNVSTLLGTATQDGTITIDLTSDPEIVIAAVKPSAPLNVTATANGNQQSVISWSTPASNGGSEITNYTVTSNTNATCTTSTTSCTISGLANGTGYTFTVTAANSVGTSVASSSASATTAAVDNAVTFDSKGGSSVTNTVFASGGTLAAPVTPTRSGFTFAGWSATDGGSAISFPYAPGVVTPITLYAKWTPVVSIVVNTTTVIAPVTVTGAKEVKISTAGVFTPISASDLRPLGVKIDENSKEFIAEVKVIEGKLVLTPVTGFSGKKIVTATITENGIDRIIQIPLTVLPENVTKPVLTPVSSSKSTIRWVASPNATAYTVYLSGKKVCSTPTTSCSVARVLGPNAVIEVISNGGDSTVSQRVDADFKLNGPLLVTRVVSATKTKAVLSSVDTTALYKVIPLVKSQGFKTIVISKITTTKKTEALAAARIAAIKKFISEKSGVKDINFEIVPATSNTYFNNIYIKG
jgi:uncharacterized repeat protein (TIGR02543 family)